MIQNVRIGSDVTIGAGAAVVSDMPTVLPPWVFRHASFHTTNLPSIVLLAPWPTYDTDQIDAATRAFIGRLMLGRGLKPRLLSWSSLTGAEQVLLSLWPMALLL